MTSTGLEQCVIILEDDVDLCESLGIYLRAVGFDAREVNDVPSFWAQMAERPADVVILDINLPMENGFSIAAKLRATTSVGIIMLTARSPQEDKILGLSLGADHYLVKPVEPAELELILRNLLRRIQSGPAEAPSEPIWTFDPKAWALSTPNGRPLSLSRAELAILQLMLEQPGAPVSRQRLQAVLVPSQNMVSRNIDTIIYRLRKRAEQVCGMPLPIHTVRNLGYVLTASVTIVS